MVADRLGDLLRVDQPLARSADGQIVEPFACPGIMLLRPSQTGPVPFLLQQRQQRLDSRPDVTDDGKINRRPPSDLLGSDIDLRDVDA